MARARIPPARRVHGRTALIFLEMDDSSEIPPAAEPFFMGLGAKITFSPVMNAQEMQSGVTKASEAM